MRKLNYYRHKPPFSSLQEQNLDLGSVSLEDVLGLLRETAELSSDPETEIAFWTLRSNLIQLVAEESHLLRKVLTAGEVKDRTHLLTLAFASEVEKILTNSEKTLERSL